MNPASWASCWQFRSYWGPLFNVNDIEDKFDENDSEIETVASDCIGATVGYILEWFGILIDMEEAIRERDW